MEHKRRFHNLILDKDTVFDESLEVHGSIIGKDGNRYNLTVNGNIKAKNLDTDLILCEKLEQEPGSTLTAKDIIAKHITAEDISAWDISAKGISANDITAYFLFLFYELTVVYGGLLVT